MHPDFRPKWVYYNPPNAKDSEKSMVLHNVTDYRQKEMDWAPGTSGFSCLSRKIGPAAR